MKVLIHANAPHVHTGYGVQCGLLADALKADGHDVAISCTWGQQGGVGSWHGMKLYPSRYQQNGNDIIHNHAMHHFGGDPSDGWIIIIADVWCLTNPLLKDFNVLAWVPIDHYPAPADVLKFFHDSGAVPVAMAEYGEKQLREAGLSPYCVPLGVDTAVFKPTPRIEVEGETVTCRELFDIPEDAFVVGMVAMNKGWQRDRKGFNEAFRAFGAFWKAHPDAVLFLHSEKMGPDGIYLPELAIHSAIPEHAIVWTDEYAYTLGLPPDMMAAAYSAMDVLLAPSHGEGFCVPLIEAQACGTPVIANNFSAQPELVGAGYTVLGQPEWDPPQHASYVVPYIGDIVEKLEAVYAQPRGRVIDAVEFAAGYDFAKVYDERWRPLLAELTATVEPLPLEREPIPDEDGIAVLVPVLNRPGNVAPLLESFRKTTNGSDAALYFIADTDDEEELAAIFEAEGQVLPATRGSTFAQKINAGVAQTREPWVFVCGDDVRFREGWIDEARKLSHRYDVIGTNDTAGATKNPDVAAGRHADHFFVRRSYIERYGASLEGPGVLAPEAYRHWYTDKEIVQLAKVRAAFSPCLESVVEHLHPGYDGREDLRAEDPTYMAAIESVEDDHDLFMSRLPLIEMQRATR